MHVRIKRHRTTIFLSVEPSDTVASVKSRLHKLTEVMPDSQQLYKEDLSSSLDDSSTLAEAGVESGSVIVLAIRNENGDWESPQIVPMDEESQEEDE